MEEAFAAKFGQERGGWRMTREGEIVHDGQAVFIPDFSFRHADDTPALLEIVGFWTPQYLARKRQTLQRFSGHPILIALPERSARPDGAAWPNVILYKTVLKVKPVLEALRARRNRGG